MEGVRRRRQGRELRGRGERGRGRDEQALCALLIRASRKSGSGYAVCVLVCGG